MSLCAVSVVVVVLAVPMSASIVRSPLVAAIVRLVPAVTAPVIVVLPATFKTTVFPACEALIRAPSFSLMYTEPLVALKVNPLPTFVLVLTITGAFGLLVPMEPLVAVRMTSPPDTTPAVRVIEPPAMMLAMLPKPKSPCRITLLLLLATM